MGRGHAFLPALALLAVMILAVACQTPAGDKTPAAPSAPQPAEGQPANPVGGGGSAGGAPQASGPSGTQVAPLPKPSSGGQKLLARLDAAATGIDQQNILPIEERAQYLYLGGGVAAGDYDNDGLVDLYIVSETTPNKSSTATWATGSSRTSPPRPGSTWRATWRWIAGRSATRPVRTSLTWTATRTWTSW